MRRVDLHLHSTASDGREAPADVVRLATGAGLAVIALTDHDTLSGVAVARDATQGTDLRVIAGCEFSVRVPWGELHLLGYFLPLDDRELEGFLAQQRHGRAERMDRIVQRLQASGVSVTLADIVQRAAGAALGRPHAAHAIVRQGAATDVNDAFDRYLGRGRPAFVAKTLPPVADVSDLIRRCGGVSSAAHLKDRAGRSALARLRDAGVDGVEVLHPAHDEATRVRIERLVRELDMLPTGGSDWHGGGVGGLGRAGLGEIPVPHEWLEAIEDLHNERRSAEATT